MLGHFKTYLGQTRPAGFGGSRCKRLSHSRWWRNYPPCAGWAGAVRSVYLTGKYGRLCLGASRALQMRKYLAASRVSRRNSIWVYPHMTCYVCRLHAALMVLSTRRGIGYLVVSVALKSSPKTCIRTDGNFFTPRTDHLQIIYKSCTDRSCTDHVRIIYI